VWVSATDEFDLYKDIDLPVPTNFYDDYSTRSSVLKMQEMEIATHMNERDLKLIPPGYLNEEQLRSLWNRTGQKMRNLQKKNLQEMSWLNGSTSAM
jgi:NADH:ubiquinone oxidoreductase subunit D